MAVGENETTTIQVKTQIRDRLASLGKKGDSFNDVISMLIEEHDQVAIKGEPE